MIKHRSLQRREPRRLPASFFKWSIIFRAAFSSAAVSVTAQMASHSSATWAHWTQRVVITVLSWLPLLAVIAAVVRLSVCLSGWLAGLSMFVRARYSRTNPLQTNASRRLPSVGIATIQPAAAADAAH